MKEEFLHYIWRFRLFDTSNLQTSEGKSIEILSVGSSNTHAGPDFQAVHLRIGNVLWVGNVEVHLHGEDWFNHHHQNDPAYDNVILHVIFKNPVSLLRQDGSIIPTLILEPRIHPHLFSEYKELMESNADLPCGHRIRYVDSFMVDNWLHRLAIDRLEYKYAAVLERLKQNKYDWEETFYQFLARNFGFHVNAVPFEMLAMTLPQRYFQYHKNNILQIEALLFGQSGLLTNELADDYARELYKEYDFLRRKYRLQAVEKHLWKFMRLRPVNFPTIRIAQFAQLILKSRHLFSKILETENHQLLHEYLKVSCSSYWQDHFVFEKKSKPEDKPFGSDARNSILINTFSLFLFAYGKLRSNERLILRAIDLLENTQAEKNSIITVFQQCGIQPHSAFKSQAIIQLQNEYCSKKKCLKCGIGNAIFRKLLL